MFLYIFVCGIITMVIILVVLLDTTRRRQIARTMEQEKAAYTEGANKLLRLLDSAEIGNAESQKVLVAGHCHIKHSPPGRTYPRSFDASWLDVATKNGDTALIERTQAAYELSEAAMAERRVQSEFNKMLGLIDPHFTTWRRGKPGAGLVHALEVIVGAVIDRNHTRPEVHRKVMGRLDRTVEQLQNELRSAVQEYYEELVPRAEDDRKSFAELSELIVASFHNGRLNKLAVVPLPVPERWNQWVFSHYDNPMIERFLGETSTKDVAPGELLLRAGRALEVSDPIEASVVLAYAVDSTEKAYEIISLRGELARLVERTKIEQTQRSIQH